MKNLKIGLKFEGKKIQIKNIKKLSEFEKGIGLMFRKKEKCPAMLFEFENPVRIKIHSLFVFFPFVTVWLDDKNKIIKKKIVKPFRLWICCEKPFYKLIEIPINKNYKKEIKRLFKN